MNKFWKMLRSKRAASSLVGGVISVSIALVIVAAVLINVGLQQFNAANQTGLTATQVTMLGLVSLFAVLGIALAFIKHTTGKGL